MASLKSPNLFLFLAKIGNTNDVNARKACIFVVQRCYIGDWFVLYQIAKNCNMYFFRTFIKELRRDMKKNPKVKHGPITKQPQMNHITKPTPSELDEYEDKFDDLERGDSDLKVALPDEETESLLMDDGDQDPHNAPTL